MTSIRIRGLLVFVGGRRLPIIFENISSLVHNMTPSRMDYGQHPSCLTQLEAHSKQAYAYQSIQHHSAIHIEAFGTSRGLYRVWANIHGQVHMSTYGVSLLIWTSGGPQDLQTHRKASNNTLPSILKHCAAFGDAWGPPEVHIWYELSSMVRCT